MKSNHSQLKTHHSLLKNSLEALLTVWLLSSVSFGQVTSEAPYKSPAMGALMGSNIALSNDGSSLLLNPAAMSTVESGFIMASTQQIFNQKFLPYNVLTTGFNLPQGLGKVGLSFESMNVSYRDESLVGETVVGISHAFNLRNDRLSSLNMGYTVKYLSVDYGKSAGLSGTGDDGMDLGSSSAIGLDLGFQSTLSKRHWLGVVVHNVNRPQIGSGGTTSILPRDIQAGFSYAPTREVVTSFALVSSPGFATEFHAGLEYELNPYLTLRSGIQSQPNRFGTGFSFNAKGIQLDYALLTHPVLPATHQFSIAYDFVSPF